MDRDRDRDAIRFIAELHTEQGETARRIVLNGVVGPRGDAQAPEAADGEAEAYHSRQLSWLAETEVDMVTALTFTQSDEAIGFVRAARGLGLPAVVSFTVEMNGRLPTGQPLRDAIEAVDAGTDSGAACFMVNGAHPEHFAHVVEQAAWGRHLRGLRCNASRLSHAELDEAEVLDDGDPEDLAGQYAELSRRLPWMNVFGGCCGSDLRHVGAIARRLAG